MYRFEKIAVATDFGPQSSRALELACELAQQYDAELVVLHVVEPFTPPYPIVLLAEPPTLEVAAQKELNAVVERARASVARVRGVLLRGSPADEVTAFAEGADGSGVDLLVIGTHGRRGPSRWVLGSVAEKIVRMCHVPVLTAHEESHEHGREGAAAP